MSRNIEPRMVDWLDQKLRDNGAAQHAIKTKDPRTLFVLANLACVGIQEIGGNNRGPLVELMQETIGRAEREAWCMSAMQTLIAYCEEKTGIKSGVFASEHCMTTWRTTDFKLRVRVSPLPGAIAIWNYEGTDKGHTGCVQLYPGQKPWMTLTEGNTESSLNPSGQIVREGGGFYMTRRSKKRVGSMVLMGFLRPFELQQPERAKVSIL